MPPAPLPQNEPARLESLRRCLVLDTDPEPGFDDLTQLASRLCGAPIALVSLLDENRQWFKSCVGLDVRETPREQAFCGYAILDDDALVIEDAEKDPRTCDNALVTGEPGIRFYAGVPLIMSDGHALGTLCVIDTVPRSISEDELEDLWRLARQATSQLELRHKMSLLRAARDQALSSTRSKSEFLANMSHEIRTPMTAILGYADLLGGTGDQTPDEQTRLEYVGTIRRNGEHLLGLINDILDLSKVESGKLETERIETDIPGLLADVLGLMRVKADAKGLGLGVEFASPIPRAATTDPVRLRQILVNLVGNAIKFTELGSVTIRASYEPGAGSLVFAVVDTGVGIAPEVMRRLFTPFSQADSSTSRTHGGTGLGLAISRRLAGALGGDIGVQSEPGKGSVFTLRIDAGKVGGETVQQLGEPAIDAETRKTPGGADLALLDGSLSGVRVLLAEDGPDSRKLIAFYLRKAGAIVTEAVNGLEAAERMTANGNIRGPLSPDHGFDVVLTDVQMPGLDGLGLTRLLRSKGCGLPIIALTAGAMSGDRERCLDAGCDAYASKPIDKAELVRVIRDALGTVTGGKRAA